MSDPSILPRLFVILLQSSLPSLFIASIQLCCKQFFRFFEYYTASFLMKIYIIFQSAVCLSDYLWRTIPTISFFFLQSDGFEGRSTFWEVGALKSFRPLNNDNVPDDSVTFNKFSCTSVIFDRNETNIGCWYRCMRICMEQLQSTIAIIYCDEVFHFNSPTWMNSRSFRRCSHEFRFKANPSSSELDSKEDRIKRILFEVKYSQWQCFLRKLIFGLIKIF